MKGIVEKNGKLTCTHHRVHCHFCRNNPHRGFPDECPEGYTKDRLPILLGDLVAKVATPIARALGMDCIDKETKELKPASACAKKKAKLNQIVIR